MSSRSNGPSDPPSYLLGPPYFIYTTSANSLVVFENDHLLVITSSGGEATLTRRELKEILFHLKRQQHLFNFFEQLLTSDE